MKITIVGCGNMGLAYARSFLKYDIVTRENLTLVEKNETRKTQLEALNIGKVVTTTDKNLSKSDIIILAVKPQDFTDLSKDIKSVLKPANIVVSIMAGIKISYLEKALDHQFVIRAMPNSPAEIGMGITGFSASKNVSIDQVRKVENLLSTTGRTIFFQNEKQLDAVTALSGSGPAYFYYILKSMIEAGKEMGVEESVSAMLMKQTMLGAFHLINNANKSLDELITAVASKGGTTEAALNTFKEKHLQEIIKEGIHNAEKRAKELSKS